MYSGNTSEQRRVLMKSERINIQVNKMKDTKQMLEFVDRFREGCQVEGWDGYTAAPLTEETLMRLTDCINLIFSYQRLRGLDWPEPFIAPTPSGDFQFEWNLSELEVNPHGTNQKSYKHHLEIEVFEKPGFASEMLREELVGIKFDVSTGDVDTPTDFLQLIELFMKEAEERK